MNIHNNVRYGFTRQTGPRRPSRPSQPNIHDQVKTNIQSQSTSVAQQWSGAGLRHDFLSLPCACL